MEVDWRRICATAVNRHRHWNVADTGKHRCHTEGLSLCLCANRSLHDDFVKAAISCFLETGAINGDVDSTERWSSIRDESNLSFFQGYVSFS